MSKLRPNISRRDIVGGGIAVSLLGAAGVSAQNANTSPNLPSDIKVIVTLNGATYSYPSGPTIPSYYVNFREDGRIVFHLGALGSLSGTTATAEPYHLPSHQVRIERAGRALLDVTIPGHWWNAEWTYRPKALAVIKTPAQLVAGNRMFPFGDAGCQVRRIRDFGFSGPMDSAGITKAMPTTGERPDLGWVTDVSGGWMLGGNSDSMLSWAQAAGSVPIHFRDESTGKPIDLTKYPKANCYGTQGGFAPYLRRGPQNAAGFDIYGGGWKPDYSHFPEMSYVAYMATKDAGFLEDLQYSANFMLLFTSYFGPPTAAVISCSQQRGLAWGLRELFMAHVATTDAEAAGTLPASCMPSRYYKTLLDNALAFYLPDLTNPANQTFQIFPAHALKDGFEAPWQQDYMVTALAFGVLTGHSDWAPVFLFALGNLISRLSGKSGWPPGVGGAYHIQIFESAKNADGDVEPNTERPLTWAQAYTALGSSSVVKSDQGHISLSAEQVAALQNDPLNGGVPAIKNAYLETTRAAMVMADYLDKQKLAKVRQTYSTFDTCLTNVQAMFRAWGRVSPKVSVISKQA